jgi:hypothetical protein
MKKMKKKKNLFIKILFQFNFIFLIYVLIFINEDLKELQYNINQISYKLKYFYKNSKNLKNQKVPK